VPGAPVQATNLETKQTYKAASVADGSYELSGLAPGAYEISVENVTSSFPSTEAAYKSRPEKLRGWTSRMVK
jgi:hypothetical protein